MFINNGGTLVSAGTPDNPIIYTSDSSEPYSGDYFCAIYIEETASPATRVTYSYIEYAQVAILTDNIRLDTPIQNNCLFYNLFGIGEYGTRHTDIRNNLLFYNYYSGIDVYLTDVNGTADGNSVITIASNTCDTYQDYGITVHGVADGNDSGLVVLTNNIVSQSYQFGLNLVDGYMYAIVSNTGYYDNQANKNWEFGEDFPVIATQNPYVSGVGLLDTCYLNQTCPFINAGSGYVDETPLIGMTTDLYNIPDSNIIDIGFHHPNWQFSNAGQTTLQADFDNSLAVDWQDLAFFLNFWLYDYTEVYEVWYWDYDGNGRVDIMDLQAFAECWLRPFDFYDFAEFANQWQKKYHPWRWDFDYNERIDILDLEAFAKGWLTLYDFRDFASFAEQWQEDIDERFLDKRPDLNKDGIVDFGDFATLANEWRKLGSAEPNIIPTLNQNPSNISGNLQISINSINNPMVHRVFLMLDGKKYSEFGNLEDGSSISIDTERFANGSHSIKIICMCEDQVIVSAPIDVTFNNSLNNVTLPDGFRPGKDFYLYALGTGNYSVEVIDIINDQVVYTGTFENGINAHIDSNVFSEPYGVYKITVASAGGMFVMQADDSFSAIIGKEFKKEDYPPNCNSKMVVSIGSSDLESEKEKCWQAALRAGVKKGFNPILLRYNDCTWDNLSYCLKLNNVKIWYHCSHGDHDLWFQPPRQCIKTADGWVFSYLKKDLNPVPPDYEELMWFYENNHSIAELGFRNTHKLNWVQFNACYSGRTCEFPFYLGTLEGDWPGEPLGDKIFIGWKNAAFASDYLAKYNQFEEDYWEALRQGDMLKNAVEWSIPHGATYILNNFQHYGVINWQYAWFRYPNIN